MKDKRNYYKEIDDALGGYERNTPYHIHDIYWICDRIDWAWKWRKITEAQKNELADRAIDVINGGLVR